VKTAAENLDVKRGRSLWLLFAVAIIAAGGLRVSSGRAAGTADSASDSLRLRTVAEFELPSPPGKRCDYLTIDEDDNYLLSAHLAAGLRRVRERQHLRVPDGRSDALQEAQGCPG